MGMPLGTGGFGQSPDCRGPQ